VPKLVTLNILEWRNGLYFAFFHRIRVRYRRKQLCWFQNLLLIVYDHIHTICTIIQRLYGQNKLLDASSDILPECWRLVLLSGEWRADQRRTLWPACVESTRVPTTSDPRNSCTATAFSPSNKRAKQAVQ